MNGMSQGGVRRARSAGGGGRRAVTGAGGRAHPGGTGHAARARQPGRLCRPADRGAVARPAGRPGGRQPAGPPVGVAQGAPVGRGGRPAGHPAARLPAAGGARGTGRAAVRAARRRRRRGTGGGRCRHGGAAPGSRPWACGAGLRWPTWTRCRPPGRRPADWRSSAWPRSNRGPRRCWPAAGTGTSIAELETLTAAHPLRERFWYQRMLALYRAGRQADALRAYRELRDILVAELAIEPGPELRELHARILRQDPALGEPRRSPGAGRGPIGRGSRRLRCGPADPLRPDRRRHPHRLPGDRRGRRDIVFVPGLMSHLELLWEDHADGRLLPQPGQAGSADHVRQARHGAVGPRARRHVARGADGGRASGDARGRLRAGPCCSATPRARR